MLKEWSEQNGTNDESLNRMSLEGGSIEKDFQNNSICTIYNVGQALLWCYPDGWCGKCTQFTGCSSAWELQRTRARARDIYEDWAWVDRVQTCAVLPPPKENQNILPRKPNVKHHHVLPDYPRTLIPPLAHICRSATFWPSCTIVCYKLSISNNFHLVTKNFFNDCVAVAVRRLFLLTVGKYVGN